MLYIYNKLFNNFYPYLNVYDYLFIIYLLIFLRKILLYILIILILEIDKL